MNTHELKTKLQKPYNREEWLKVATGIFKNVSILSKPLPIGNAKDFVKSFQQLGFVNLEDGRNLAIIEVKVDDTKKLSSNKVELRNLTSNLIDEHTTNGVLVIYDNDMDGNYRFSFVTKETGINEETGRFETKETSAKRFTYLLGPGESCSTAAMQLSQIANKDGHAEMEDVIKAFNVEKVNKDFFNGYKKQYEAFTAHLINTSFKASVFNGNEKAIRDFAKKMMGRIVFIYFLQKKGWMGVPESETGWTNGDPDFLCNLFNESGRGEDFYAVWLSTVFFNCLNTERAGQLFKLPDGTKVKVPYLNGGLFEKENSKTELITFPSALFQNLFDFLGQYNFTIYEDDPEERFLAVDPEMLGHIFENLLEDNKDKGTFYTPKEIVHYMCRESLIEYLYTKLNPSTTETYKELGKTQTDLFGNKQKKQLSLEHTFGSAKEVIKREAIEKLVLHHEAAEIINYEKEILKALFEVKICDPAIGSGAFPMGLLTEIFQLVEALHHITPDVTAEVWKLGDTWNAAAVKKQIIQNSIYGVDIEKGAVDIARLRFWLSLIIDEEEPKPLPNLDYKIVVGNSLLSKFDDKVIDINWEMNSGKAVDKTRDIILNQEKKLYALQHNQHLYFNQSTGNKKKLQEEIRDIKIDILINQLTLNKISFTEKNPKLGGLLPTPKETQKNLENQLIEKDLDNTIQKLTTIKHNKNLLFDFFDWKLDFAEVMNEKIVKGKIGFDIVIGNPPYVNIVNIKEPERKILQTKFTITKNKVDLYAYFIEAAKNLIKDDGSLVFIIPQTWKATDSFSKFREFIFSNFQIKSIVNLDMGVFDAVVRPLILFLKATKSEDYSISIMNNKFKKQDELNLQEIKKSATFVVDTESSKDFKRVFKSIANNTINLGGIIKFTRGIKTSNDSRFISKQPQNKDYKKVFRGKNIKAYSLNWNHEYIWYRPDLMREKVGCLPHTKELFETPEKLVTQRVNSSMQLLVAYDDDSNYFLDTTNVSVRNTLVGNFDLKYLLAILNSKPINFWYSNNYRMPTIGLYELHTIPIKVPDYNQQTAIKKKVELILELKKEDSQHDTTVLQKEIDVLVYKLYELTYEEACIVEGNKDWMSKDEYEKFTV